MIRQYCFCPRIPYFCLMRELQPAQNIWMAQGADYHQKQEMLQKRRSLCRFGINAGEFAFKNEVRLNSEELGLYGVCDGVLETDAEIIPLEFKMSNFFHPSLGAQLQLAAYGVLLQKENVEQIKQVKRGFILAGDKGKTFEVRFDEEIMSKVTNTLTKIRNICENTLIPPSSATERQCSQCEFLNFCADRL